MLLRQAIQDQPSDALARCTSKMYRYPTRRRATNTEFAESAKPRAAIVPKRPRRYSAACLPPIGE